MHAANRRRAADELDAAGYLGDQRLELVRAIQKARARLRSHGAAAAAVSGVLFMINVVSDSSGPWFMIPAAVLGITVVLHAVRSSDRRSSLQEQLAQSGLDWQKIEARAATASASPRRGGSSRRVTETRRSR